MLTAGGGGASARGRVDVSKTVAASRMRCMFSLLLAVASIGALSREGRAMCEQECPCSGSIAGCRNTALHNGCQDRFPAFHKLLQAIEEVSSNDRSAPARFASGCPEALDLPGTNPRHILPWL